MPAKLESCVQHLMDKGHDEKSAWAICQTSMNMSMNKGKDQTDVNKCALELAEENKKIGCR